MKDTTELKRLWEAVRECYHADRERENSPATCADLIVKKVGLDDALEVFSAVIKYKAHDGRISQKSRDVAATIPTHPLAAEHSHENDLIHADLDDIHTAHVEQMFQKLCNRR